ncbi:MAG: PHP domain-containing protein [Planctomycetes bacterium]|nr:PHP domain-containing protein [Planctomycetota bacterium]
MRFEEKTPARGRGEGYQEYVGGLHVHTEYSDGSASMERVIQAARATGIDFLVIADHDSLGAKKHGFEGWRDGVLVMVGVEISPWRKGHCLAWGVDTCVGYRDADARVYLGQIARQKGAAFAAHPEGKSRPCGLGRVEVWSDWDTPHLAGMEVWSFMHDWSEGVWPFGLHQLPFRFLDPARWLRGPSVEILRRWDRIGQERRFVGIGSLDAHEVGMPLVPWRWLSCERIFETVRTHIRSERLAGDAERDIRTLRSAIEGGRCHIANDRVCDSTGFDFWGETAGGIIVSMGEEVAYERGVTLHVTCPAPACVRLLRNGADVAFAEDDAMRYEPTGAGVYRVEVRWKTQPWIFSNPIYLRSRQG